MLDAYKELTPVVYGENAIKYLKIRAGAREVCFSMHWHDRMELLYIESGHLDLYLGQEHFNAAPGQVAVIVPRMMHCGIAGETGVSYHTIMFDVEKFCNGTGASEKYLAPVCRYRAAFETVAEQPEVAEAAGRLVEVLSGGEGRNPLVAVGIIYELIGFLYQHCAAGPGVLHRVDKGFGEVLEYMNAHFAERISARDISERFGYNEAYFCRRFKAVTGITVMKYIQILRMERAQKLLKNTNEEIGNIAWKCGFADIGYFSNCFKRHFGYRPAQFRKMNEK